MNDADYDRLNQLRKDQVIDVLAWTIEDLNNWSNNPNAIDRVQGYAGMLEEAVWYQVSKAERQLTINLEEE